MTTSPTQGEHAQPEALRLAESITRMDTFTDFQRQELDKAAAKLRSLHAQVAALTAAPQGGAYAELPMQFACSGVFPVYSADQMRDFADRTHARRTKSEASREFLERILSAMEGVIDVADRQTDEFEALRSCVVDLTLMLFKPEALRASHGQAPAGAAPEVDLPDAEDMAHSALQEALSFGLSHDVVYRWMRAIQDQTIKAMAAAAPTAQPAPAATKGDSHG